MSYKNNREMHMNQAEGTVRTYIINAKNALEELFGEGFVEENPALLERYVRSCTIQYQADIIADGLEAIAKALKDEKEY